MQLLSTSQGVTVGFATRGLSLLFSIFRQAANGGADGKDVSDREPEGGVLHVLLVTFCCDINQKKKNLGSACSLIISPG